MRDRAARESARSSAQALRDSANLRRSETLLNRERQHTNDLLREYTRLQREGHGQSEEAVRTSQAIQRATERENAALERHNNLLEEQRGAFQRTAREAMTSLRQTVGSGISNLGTTMVEKARAQIDRAHASLLANTRDFSNITAGALASATTQYTGLLASAVEQGIKYAQNVDEITQAQYQLVQAMNVDVSQAGWSGNIEAITNDMANLASRTDRTVAEIQTAQLSMAQIFGRGSQREVAAFSHEMMRTAMLPEVLRERFEAAGQEAGMLFDNRQTQMMIETWTEQFGDQATHLSEMSANMLLFGKRAADAGHSVRTTNNLMNALAQGTMGRREDDAITVRAGHRLREQLQEPGGFEAATTGMSAGDKEIMRQLMASNSALADSDIAHMLSGTTQGMQAVVNSLVGVYDMMAQGDISGASRLLTAEGFNAGNPNDQLRLMQLMQQMHENGADNTAEIQQLLGDADARQQEQETAANTTYNQVAAAARAAEMAASGIQILVQNTGPGGAIIAAITGGAVGVVLNAGNHATVRTRLPSAQTITPHVANQLLSSFNSRSNFDMSNQADLDQVAELMANVQQRYGANSQQYSEVRAHLDRLGMASDPDVNRRLREAVAARMAAHAAAQQQQGPMLPTQQPNPAATPHVPPSTTANTINQATAPARTPASVPTPPPAPARTGPQGTTPRNTPPNGTTVTPVGPVTGRVNPNGSATFSGQFTVPNWTPMVMTGVAQGSSTSPIGTGP